MSQPGRLPRPLVPDGHGAKGFSLLYGVGAGGFGFLDGCVVSDLFRWRAMPSSQTNFCWWTSMDDLVASSPPRVLLASSQRWLASSVGAPPLGPGVSAVGKEAAGISSREASPISASSGVLTWDDVSTGLERSPGLWGRGVSTTTGFSPFGVEFTHACPDMSNTTQDRSSLTSMVMLTSLLAFGRIALMELAIRMEGQMPEGNAFNSGPSAMDCGIPTFR